MTAKDPLREKIEEAIEKIRYDGEWSARKYAIHLLYEALTLLPSWKSYDPKNPPREGYYAFKYEDTYGAMYRAFSYMRPPDWTSFEGYVSILFCELPPLPEKGDGG